MKTIADLWIGYQALKEENRILKKLINELTVSNNGILKAYIIHNVDFKKHIVCGHCYQNGEVKTDCNKCGGKGTHYKTFQRWEICKRPVEIIKIDRSPNGEELRFWNSQSEFYESRSYVNSKYPDGISYIHFTIYDAERECDRLNRLNNKT